MVTSSGGNEIFVSKYSVRDGDQKRTISTQIDEVIRAIVELGGAYPDVVQALQEAKSSGVLASRFEVDALPTAGRIYDRLAEDEVDIEENGDANGAERDIQAAPARPAPELFAKRGVLGGVLGGESDANSEKEPNQGDNSEEKSKTKKGFFARMLGQ